MAANVIFKSGTRAQYNGGNIDSTTFYRVVEDNGSINLYLGSELLSNEDELQGALSRIGVNETNIKTNADDIADIIEDLKSLKGEGTGSISSQLESLENRLNAAIGENSTKIADNTTAIGNEVSRAQLAEGALETLITNLTTTVNDNETDIEAKVKANADAIAEQDKTLDNHDSFIQALQAKDTELAGAIATEKGRVDKLVGDDAGKSARAIAAEETAKIVAGADTKYDTLKEIADWITNDTTGAADMANDIKALQELTEGHTTLISNNGTEISGVKGRVDTLEGKMTTAEGNITKNSQAITANEQAIAAMKDGSTGILAQAKKYTDDEISGLAEELNDSIGALDDRMGSAEDRIGAVEDDIADINNTSTGILAKATEQINALRDELGTAAKKDVEYFTNDSTTKANQALADAKTYADQQLVAAKAYTDTCLTWQGI
jgi:predicted  nucleic acid-binding Zn-ribbon protein